MDILWLNHAPESADVNLNTSCLYMHLAHYTQDILSLNTITLITACEY